MRLRISKLFAVLALILGGVRGVEAACRVVVNPIGVVEKVICVPDTNPIDTQGKTVSSSATWTFLGSEHGLATCDLNWATYTSGGVWFEPNSFSCNATTYDVTVTLAGATTGRLVLSGRPTNQVLQAFTSVTSVTITHNYGSADVVFSCYDGSGNMIGPDTVNSGANALTVTFLASQSGRCVVMR